MEVVVLTRFKNGLVQFIDQLIDWMPEDGDLVVTRILVNDQLPITEIMGGFIKFVYPYRDLIKKSDEKFFLGDTRIFDEIKDQSRVLSLKKLWQNPRFSKDDKEKTWEWVQFFVKCMELYLQHTGRTYEEFKQ